MADIVDDFLLRLQQQVPDLPADVAPKLERTLRAQWGGTEPYVGKRLSISTRTRLVANGLQKSRSLKECFAQAGVSSRTGYRILKRK